jgi:predicted nucleotide-binding protein (sugar kinase/HSP70/actin superfamily)
MKILYGGLTEAHNILIKGAMESLGYDVEPLPTPDNEALKIGKEYCNKGQCNPTYYTVGNLLKYLFEKSKTEKDIESNYIFVTVGSCGPCRFGMYEMEYRKDLKEAGFPNFKVIAIEQSEALLEELGEENLKFDRKFFMSLLKAIMLGDLINDIYYQVKPYELEKGKTDLWREESLNLLYETLKGKKSVSKALKEVKRKLERIEVNLFQPKPKVKITGEFFAQTTEGDGNYRMAKWLIEEGAEPIVEPVTTWIEYLIFEKIQDLKEKLYKNRWGNLKIILFLKAFNLYLRWLYNYYRRLLGNKPYPLKDQKLLAKYAERYYHPRLVGGEGHMEVGKHIYMIKHKKAHMVLSVKPFGCMPSTQSDGVQSKVMEDLGGSLFVSVETSGDAEANVKSRILMTLYEAKMKAIEEYEMAKAERGLTDDDINKALLRREDIKNPLIKLPHKYVATAANAVLTI